MAAKTNPEIRTETVQYTASVDPKVINDHKVRELEHRRKNLVHTYEQEPLVTVSLAPQYAAHFGKIMRVTLNGISVAIPVNGTSCRVPQSFASEINARRVAIDKQILRQQRMANIQNNIEGSPGQLGLF